jgi:hypothetical protein
VGMSGSPEVRKSGPGDGHRSFQASGVGLQEALTPLVYVGGAVRGHLGHGVRPCFLALALHRLGLRFRRLLPYGMATVTPPVVAVKR